MVAKDFVLLLHPAFAVIVVFPLIGMVVSMAWQTRQRRIQTADKRKSKIPAVVGPDHLKFGRWLATSVIFATLLGLAAAIGSKMVEKNAWSTEPGRVTFVILMFILTIASYGFLYRAKLKIWRGIFASLTGMGVIVLGCQPEVFRRGFEWYISHYYSGVLATLLMILSVAVVQDIYQDREHRWRRAHTFLNAVATLLFAFQGFSGARDIFEIALYKTPPGFIFPGLL